MATFDAGTVYARLKFDNSEFEESAGQTEGRLDKIGKAAGKVLAKGFDLAAKGIEQSVIAANKFNKEFSNVTTLVDPALVDINKMRDDLLGLDNRLGSATDLTNGLYQAISASVEPAKAVEFVGEAAKFAKAGLTSTNKAVDVITTSLNAYGLEADQAGRVSDILFTTIKKGKTTGAQLASSIGKSIPLAASAGVKLEELGATLAVLTRQGNSSAQATTQINSTISSLIKPSVAAKEALKSFGFESAEAAIESEGLVGTIKGMIAQTDGSQESIAKLFPNIRALRGALALTGKGAADFDEVLESMKNSAGATSEAFEKQELTFETFGNAVNKLSISLGTELLPFVYTVTQFFTDFVEQLTQSGTLADILTTAVGYASGAFELLTSVLGPLVNDILLSGQEEIEEIGMAIQGAGDETKAAQIPFQIFAKGLSVLGSVADTLIKGFGLLTKTIVGVVNTANAAGKVLEEIGKLVTFQESDVVGAFSEVGAELDILVGNVVDGVAEVTSGTLDTISALFADTSAEALEMQKIFEAGMAKGTGELNKYTVAARNATDTTHDLNISVAGFSASSGIAAEQLSVTTTEAYAYNDAMAALNTTLDDTSLAEKKATMDAEILNGILGTAIEGAIDIGIDSLSSLNSALIDTGMAFGAGADGMATFADGIGNVAAAILKALPNLLLQAGLALLPTNLPLGLGLIAGSAVASIGAGAVIGALGLDTAADGGTKHGLTLVGEQGPELVNLGSPSMVVPNEQTQSMMGGAMNFYFTGPINSEIDMNKAAIYFGRQMQAERTRIR